MSFSPNIQISSDLWIKEAEFLGRRPVKVCHVLQVHHRLNEKLWTKTSSSLSISIFLLTFYIKKARFSGRRLEFRRKYVDKDLNCLSILRFCLTFWTKEAELLGRRPVKLYHDLEVHPRLNGKLWIKTSILFQCLRIPLVFLIKEGDVMDRQVCLVISTCTC